MRRHGGELAVEILRNGAQIQDDPIVEDAPDQRRLEAAEPRFESGSAQLIPLQRKQHSRQLHTRSAATSDGGAAADERDTPSGLDELLGERAGSRFDGVHVEREHPTHRHGLVGTASEVFDQRRFERGVGQLVNAERAHQGVSPERLDQRRASDEDPGLRAAEQLVAAEAHEIAPRGERRSHHRLVGQRGVEVAAAEVFDHRD